ncbi:hypothetical protein FG379_003568 [Cryptosporidium bovis]|uniref:uncharacterized protein n=1 Tax=Cryptosporidium bovis TaxID=310047 RepID=UPI00351A4A59|nr:hypothetical protein FG379_003568 [Cryptosporidium bovis]
MWKKEKVVGYLDGKCISNKIISYRIAVLISCLCALIFNFNVYPVSSNTIIDLNSNNMINDTRASLVDKNTEVNSLPLLSSDFKRVKSEINNDTNVNDEIFSKNENLDNKIELIAINGDDVFEKVVNENDYLLVLFTAPWCGMSKRAVEQINEMIEYLDSVNKSITDHSIDLFSSKKIVIGLVSVPEYPNLSKKLNVLDYPTIKLVKKDSKYKVIDYYGNIYYKKVLCWLIQQVNVFYTDNINAHLIKIKNISGLNLFTTLNNNVIVYFNGNMNNENGEYKLISDISKIYNNIIIGEVKINELPRKSDIKDDNKLLIDFEREVNSYINENNNNSFILIFNSEKVVSVIKSPFKNENIILNKIDSHLNNNVIMLNSETIGEILNKENDILLLIFNGNSYIDYFNLKKETSSTVHQFYNIMKKLKAIRNEKMRNINSEIYYNEKILYVISGNEGPTNRRFMDYLHIKDEMLPSVFIIKDLNISPPKKYYLDLPKVLLNSNNETDALAIDKENESNWIVLNNNTSINFSPNIISDFIDKVNSGLVNNTYHSQNIPLKQNSPVYILVGDSFKEIVHDSNKDVLVLFYTPWCGHCKTFEPIYNEIANIVSSKTNILIAKIDMSSNFVPEDQIGGKIFRFPTIKLFKKRDKKNPIDFDGERETNTILDFIWIHTARDEL